MEHDCKKIPYKPATNYEFLDQKRKRKVQEMKKLIHKFDIKTDELGLQSAAYKTLVRIPTCYRYSPFFGTLITS